MSPVNRYCIDHSQSCSVYQVSARRLHCLSGAALVTVAPLPNYTAMQRRTIPTTCRGIMATQQARKAANKDLYGYVTLTGITLTDVRGGSRLRFWQKHRVAKDDWRSIYVCVSLRARSHVAPGTSRSRHSAVMVSSDKRSDSRRDQEDSPLDKKQTAAIWYAILMCSFLACHLIALRSCQPYIKLFISLQVQPAHTRHLYHVTLHPGCVHGSAL